MKRKAMLLVLIAIIGVSFFIIFRGREKKPVIRKPPPRVVPVLPSPKTEPEQSSEPTPPTVVEAPVVNPPVVEELVVEAQPVAEVPTSEPSLEERLTSLEREFEALDEALRAAEDLAKD